MKDKLRIFALNDTKGWGEEVAAHIGVPLSRHEEKYFHDRESYCASLENVRGRDCYVIQSLYTDSEESVNSKLMKMLIFIGSLKDASAARITAVMPYMPYSRQDRKTASRAPITTKYTAKLFESVGTNRILTIDAHNPSAIQNAYSINVDLLEANGLLAKYMAQQMAEKNFPGVTVMSPDSGGMGRARKFRSILERYTNTEISLACLDKTHNNDDIRGNDVIGKVGNRAVIVLDDMISSGKTILECVQAAMKHGATHIMAAAATHGLFVGKCNEFLDNKFLASIVVSDTIKPHRLTNERVRNKLVVIKTAELFGEAIKRTHMNESITDLIEKNGCRVIQECYA